MSSRLRILVPMGLEGGSRYLVTHTYTDALREAGAAAYMFAGPLDAGEADRSLEGFAGLLLTGGGDLAPRYLGESPHPGLGEVDPPRDALEWDLLGAALARRMPILGICRGCQVLAARVGGQLYQDIPSQMPGALQHAQRAPREHESHSVSVVPGSQLYRVFGGREEVWVNSFHHQGVRSLSEGWRACAHAPDGLIEAFEREGEHFALGIQWHPEGLVRTDPLQRTLFAAFVAAAARYATEGAPAR